MSKINRKKDQSGDWNKEDIEEIKEEGAASEEKKTDGEQPEENKTPDSKEKKEDLVLQAEQKLKETESQKGF